MTPSLLELLFLNCWQIFFFQGRFIFGPDARSLALTIFLIVAPVSVFCVFVARKLMDDFSNHLGILIMVVVIVFTFYVSSLSLLLIDSNILITCTLWQHNTSINLPLFNLTVTGNIIPSIRKSIISKLITYQLGTASQGCKVGLVVSIVFHSTVKWLSLQWIGLAT